MDTVETAERLFTILKSLNEFDKTEIRGIIQTLIAPTRRDLCFTGNYYRGIGNIESLLTLKSVRDFQAIAMIARAMFEIAVDIRLVGKMPGSEDKVMAYAEVEKLRSARRIVAFKRESPTSALDATIYETFIAGNANRIEQEAKALWPDSQINVHHWSGKKFERRIELVGAPFDQIYAVNYPQLSWYAHSGLTGVINLEKESFRVMAGVAFTVAAECYMAIMGAVIAAFRIDKANDKIEKMMILAKMLPFTDGALQADQLRGVLLG